MEIVQRKYTKDEVLKATEQYFNGDQLATNVFLKYALRSDPDTFRELTPDDMHKRMAKEFARIENQYPNSLKEDEIYELFKDFKWVVPQGSPMYGIGNNFQNVSLSNCVVVDSPIDTISSIVDSGKDLANLFKRRCGVGIDISNLRPDGSRVSNSAGTSTGAWSFADFYSYVCRMIGQNNRRGALMITMDVKHPDIFKFVKMKRDLTKVTGANISIKLTDEFMQAVEGDKVFQLQFPVNSEDPQVTNKIHARTLWKEIVESATSTAEPGLLMWDNITQYMPADCYPEFRTISTNPCSEIPLSANDACRLISINLKNFVKDPFTESASFDWKHFGTTVRKSMRLMDDLVDLEIEKLENIINVCDTEDEKELWRKLKRSCEQGRRTGLGTHGLADMLARMTLKYDSKASIELVDKLYESLKLCAYDESRRLAEERGAFPAFDWELEKDCKFYDDWPLFFLEEMERVGRRNISILTCAPTGSVSIESQTSSGVEPVFRNSYTRRRKLDHDQKDVKPDFVDELGDKWVNFTVLHHNVREYVQITGNEEVPDYFVTSDQIDWKRRVEIQSVMQKHIDHAISSTINLPNGTSSDEVAQIYLEGWKRGLKGVTVYVDGSRTGVLISEESKVDRTSGFLQIDAPKRPKTLPIDIHVMPQDQTALVGLLDDMPYEIMIIPTSYLKNEKFDFELEAFLEKDRTFKTRETRYVLHGHFEQEGGKVGYDSITEIQRQFILPNESRMVSLALRHGTKPSFVVEQLQKTTKDFFAVSKNIARVLKKYIEDGESVSSDKICRECGHDSLVYVEGCVTCTQCSWSKCS